MKNFYDKMHIKLYTMAALALSVIGTSLLTGLNMTVHAEDTTEWTYNCTGAEQVFTAPSTGKYYIEAIGGDGGGFNLTPGDVAYGSGGIASGYYYMQAGDTLYIQVGGKGGYHTAGGYNGGGDAYKAYSGGGATSISLKSGLLKDLSQSDLICVAGGGGGYDNSGTKYNRESIGADGVRDEAFYCGCGSSSNGVGSFIPEADTNSYSAKYAVSYYDTGASTITGYAYGVGESSNSTTGAGGGGLYGGYIVKDGGYDSIGGGGSGYKGGLTIPLSDTMNVTGIRTATDGTVNIKYNGSLNAQITVDPNQGGTYDGKSGLTYLYGNYMDKIVLDDPIPNEGLTFIGWTVTSGNKNTLVTDNTILILDDAETMVKATYKTSGIKLTQTLVDSSTLNLSFFDADMNNKLYKVQQSVDAQNWQDAVTNDEADGINSLPKQFLLNYSLWQATGYNYTYKYVVPMTGVYTIEAYGARGGNVLYGGRLISRGGYGGYVTGNISLTKGDILYIYSGRSGNDRSGLCQQTDGGDASDIRLNGYSMSDRILIAAGGGGSSYYDASWGSANHYAYGGNGGYPAGGNGAHTTYYPDSRINFSQIYATTISGATQTRPGYGCHNTDWNFAYYVTSVGNFSSYNNGNGGGGWYSGSSNWFSNILLSGAGGSSYYNPSYITDFAYKNGVRNGDGFVTISLKDADYYRCNTDLADVKVIDSRAPSEPIDYKLDKSDNISVAWADSTDTAELNYYRVQSVLEADESTVVDTSNTVSNSVCSGVKGYYYYIDANTDGNIDSTNIDTCLFTETPVADVDLSDNGKYIHVAAVDNAGNISDTTSKYINVPQVTYIVRSSDKGCVIDGTSQSVFNMAYNSAIGDSIADYTMLNGWIFDGFYINDVKYTKEELSKYVVTKDTTVELRANIGNLELTADGRVDDDHTHGYAHLDWTDIGGKDIVYKVEKKSDSTWESVGKDYKDVTSLNLLQIYPIANAANQCKSWIEDSGYGHGIIHVSSVSIDAFNANPDYYLKDSDGNYKYDVLFFGSWDSNNNRDLTTTSRDAVISFIKTGRGVFFGHDTVRDIGPNAYNNFSTLQSYCGLGSISLSTQSHDNGFVNCPYVSTSVQILQNSMLFNYPNNVGGAGTILNIPRDHVSGCPVTDGSLLMKFVNYPTNGGIPDSEGYNYYLSVKNNCASIGTGHSNGASTSDEQKIISNLVYYLDQRITDSELNDPSAQDFAAPDAPSITFDNTENAFTLLSKDNGTDYTYRVSAYDEDSVDGIYGNALKISNEATATVTTGVTNYRYIFDNNASTTVTSNTGYVSTDGKVCCYGDGAIIETTGYRYMHVAAVDRAGNISKTASYEMSYHVQFDGNGATYNDSQLDEIGALKEPVMAMMTCYMGNTYTLPINKFAKDNFEFVTWNTKADGTGITYGDGQSFKNLTLDPGSYVTLYAQWHGLNSNQSDLWVKPNSGSYTPIEKDGSQDSYQTGKRNRHYIYNPETDRPTVFGYVGSRYQTYTVPYTGYYFIQANGAQGGGDACAGGGGGIVKSYVKLTKGQVLYISVGQQGWCSGAENNLGDYPTYGSGGRVTCNCWDCNYTDFVCSGVGGGATTVATDLCGNGDIRNYINNKSSILMAAGGGGGGSDTRAGKGGIALYNSNGLVSPWNDTSQLNGQFGTGSQHSNAHGREEDGGAGGGGYVGGCNGWDSGSKNGSSSSGGGASYVNTSRGCYNYNLIPAGNYGNGSVSIIPFDKAGAQALEPDPTRIGWTFVDWIKDTTDSRNVLHHDPLWWVEYRYDTTTVTARWTRTFTLKLADDDVSDTVGTAFKQQIYDNPTKYFTYKDGVNNTTGFDKEITRTKGNYTATFELNNVSVGQPTDNTTLVDLGNADTDTGNGNSTNLNIDSSGKGTITAYPTFKGWSTEKFVPGEYLGTYPGTIIGSSGTQVDVKTVEDYATKYNINGNTATAAITSSDNSTTIYADWNRAKIKLPNATRNEDKTDNGEKPDYFLGWFTEPQLSEDTTDGGSFVGYAGDIVYIDRDITLYPWFNVAPTIVRSDVTNNFQNDSETDKTNLFWEGESVTYKQLLTLIDATDTDDSKKADSDTAAHDDTIEWNGLNSWKDIYALNIEAYMNTYLNEHYPDMTAEEHDAAVKKVRENLETYENHYNADNGNGMYDTIDFEPVLTSVTYSADGLDDDGNAIPNAEQYTQTVDDIKNNGLNTEAKHIGNIVLHYQITDNGTFDYYNDKYVWAVNGYKVNSQVTVNFDLHTELRFDEAPVLKLSGAMLYANDPTYTSDNIRQYLIDKQKVSDYEDDYDNSPWWIKGSQETDSGKQLAYVSDTRQKLVDSIEITGIKDIEFQSGYENELENKDIVAAIKQITNLEDLFSLKKSANAANAIASGNFSDDAAEKAFEHISSFRVTTDSTDQWGKKSSTDICGQTEDERTFQVIQFNDDSDDDLGASSVKEKLRYISEDYTGTLNSNEYWGDYGKDTLADTFKKYDERETENHNTYSGTIANPTPSNKDNTVKVTINDYTDK